MASLRHCAEKMSELLEETDSMRESGFDPATIEDIQSRNELIGRFLSSPLGDHLRSVDGQEDRFVSGGGLLGSQSIKEHILDLLPSAVLFPRGYLPIWACDGNTILYGLDHQRFYWVGHDSLIPDCIIVLASTGEVIDYSEEDVPRALAEFSVDVPSKFISDLIDGAYDSRVKELAAR